MGRFEGHLETLSLRTAAGSSSQPPVVAYILRNFDGQQGVRLARSLEGCYGVDVLESRGSTAKCAAAMGNNCQDDYVKLFPPRMFMDDASSAVMKDLLDGTMAAVNASLPAGACRLGLEDGAARCQGASRLVTGETQVLRFAAPKTAAGRGSKMHVHVDKPGTRWVAILSLGPASRFVFDYAFQCERCFLPSQKPEHAKLQSRKPNLTRGGTGEKGEAKKWHTTPCVTCQEIQLRSGDCLLFDGAPGAGVGHGSLGTFRKGAEALPADLPAWAMEGRVSVQYRLSAGCWGTNKKTGEVSMY